MTSSQADLAALQSENARLRAELERVEVDAGRYRWLRDEPSSHLYVRLKEKTTISGMSVCSGVTLDYEVDKRLAQPQEPSR